MGHSFLYRMMMTTISLVVTPNTLSTNTDRHQVMMMTPRCLPAGRIIMPVVCLHLWKMMSWYNCVVLAECIEYLLTQGISIKSHGTPLIFLEILSSITLETGLEVKCQVTLRPDLSPGMNRFPDLVQHLQFQGLTMNLLSLLQNNGLLWRELPQSPSVENLKTKWMIPDLLRMTQVVARKRWQIFARKGKLDSLTFCLQKQYHQMLMTFLASQM